MKKKLIAAAFLCIIILGLGALAFSQFSLELLNNSRADVQGDAEALLGQESQKLESGLYASGEMVELFADGLSDLDKIEKPELCQRIEKMEKHSYFRRVLVAYPDGNAVDCDGRTYKILTNPAFSCARDGTTKFTIRSGIINPDALVVSTAIVRDCRLYGVVLGEFDMQYTAKMLNVDVRRRSATSLVSYDGSIIIKPPGMQELLHVQRNIFELLDKVKFTGDVSSQKLRNQLAYEENAVIEYETDGELRNTFFLPVGINNWYLMHDISVQTMEANMQPIRRMVSILVTKLTLLALLLGALLMYMFNWGSRTEERREVLEERVQYDQMTQLYNRTYALKVIKERMDNAPQLLSALIVCDLNKFKQINDTYGHQMGDEVLIKVAHTLRTSFRSDECPSRIGGDEFLVYMSGVRDMESLRGRMEKIRDKVACLRFSNPDVNVAVSIGIVMANGKGSEAFDRLFALADANMYRAKRGESEGIVIERLKE